MMTSVFLNLIYILFPLSCYFMYLVYSKAIYKKEKTLFFDLAILSSCYLCSRFAGYPIVSCFMINLPLLLAIYKKRGLISIALSVGISCFVSFSYDVNLILFLMQYFIIMFLCYFTKLRPTCVYVICKMVLGIIISLLLPTEIINRENMFYCLSVWALMYPIFEFIIIFYNKLEAIVNMYNSLEMITKEKKLYESLFKITHEIKNPLAVCKGYVDMFDITNAAKANKFIRIISQEIERTLLLLKDFSDISKLNIEKSLIDVNMLLEDVCDEASLILENGINFVHGKFEEEVYIFGDYNRLKQVFLNVLKNAKEAIIEDGKIEIITRKTKSKYVISIKDNGIGMDKETSKKIGTAFYTTKKNGTGLGVCFSKEIIEKHDGSIKYCSRENKGTIVRIILPISKAPTS